MPEKKYLFTPGPTPVPWQVLAALAEPVLHHRGADFKPTFERCLARLREVCRTESDVLLFTASGTAGMESAVANLCAEGTRALVVSAGYFGERWEQIATLHGAAVEPAGAPGAHRAAQAMQIPVYSSLTDEQTARVARVVRAVLAQSTA